MKTSGGSTSSLHKHLKLHSIEINQLKRPCNDTVAEIPAKKLITNYFVQNDNSLESILARMTSSDGLPFRFFITSMEERKSLIARGFNVPKSATTIRNMVIDYGLNLN